MGLFKKNTLLSESFSLFTSILSGWLFCVVIFISCAGLIKYSAAVVIIQIVQIILMLLFVYTNLWEKGDRDNNRVQFGRIEKDYWHGLKVGLIGTSPFLLCSIFLIMSRFGLFPDYIVVYRIINVFNIHIINAIVGTASSIMKVPVGNVIVAASLPLAIPLISTAAYIFGFKRIAFAERLIYTKKTKK